MIWGEDIQLNNATMHPIAHASTSPAAATLTVLRLDKLHPVASGNKWFKLKFYLHLAMGSRSGVATFGGAWSNHILATAFACHQLKIPCTGFIRGEEPKQYGPTLSDARALNMRLEFLSRTDYRDKEAIKLRHPNLFIIAEGGYGATGARGAAEILQHVPDLSTYTHIVCATGTGTMLAGIANASLPHQQCIGISVMKNNNSLQQEVDALLIAGAGERVCLLHNYHFGGYAKHTNELLQFMNLTWTLHALPLDLVYTAKAFFAAQDLLAKRYFPPGAKILFIHSGGLQGNRSLPPGRLLF